MTRTSPLISVMLPMIGLLMVVGLFGLTILGGGGTAPTQALSRVNTFSLPIDYAHIEKHGHASAIELVKIYETGVCEGKWVGYNVTQGRVLVACRIKDTTPPACLLVSYQITENHGSTLLVEGPEGAHHITAYVDECWRAYKRNGYSNWDDAGTWVVAPLDLKAAIISAFGEP